MTRPRPVGLRWIVRRVRFLRVNFSHLTSKLRAFSELFRFLLFLDLFNFLLFLDTSRHFVVSRLFWSRPVILSGDFVKLGQASGKLS